MYASVIYFYKVMKLKRTNLLTGAVLLTATGFILRGLGMILRIYISKRLGEEGMGLYQLAQSVYFLFITIAQSGVSVALTRVLSARLAVGDTDGAQSAVTVSCRLSVVLGTAAAAVMSILAYPICRFWIGDMRCLYPMISLSLALPFVALCGVLSAYFIVLSKPIYGCISQMTEQIIRIALALSITPLSLTALGLSGSVGWAVSCLFLVICYKCHKKRAKRVKMLKNIVSVASGVAATRYLASVLHTVENILVPNAIAVYTGVRAEALSQFGALKGMALPLLFFPYSILSAITTLIVPRLTASQATGDKEGLCRKADKVCSLTLTLSVPVAAMFFAFSKQLGELIYSSDKVSSLLASLSFILPFMYLDSVCDGFLKGLGKQNRVLLHNCIDSGIRILLVCIAVPHTGLYGFVGVMVISNVFVSLMNYYTLCKTTGMKPAFWRRILLPLTATLPSLFLTNFLFKNSATLPKLVASILLFYAFFAIFYSVLSALFKKYKN